VLSFTKTLIVVAEIGLHVPTYPEFVLPNYSTLSFFGVYGPKFKKISTLLKRPRDCLPYTFKGVALENFSRIAKNYQF